jgi:hypothetical protein
MTEDRKSIAARIRALLSKTVDKGCTEQEALAAAAKAKELMDRYQVDLSETELEDEGFAKGTAESAENRRFNAQDWIVNAIAAYCDVKCWRTQVGSRKWRYVFFGLRSDVEFANWLLKGLEAFIWQKADEFGGLYLDKRNFAMGCANRISQRLREEVSARKAKTQTMSSGRELVVVKQEIVQREFNKLGLRLRSGASRSYVSGGSSAARAAGYAAGNGASFGRPVSAGRSTLRIS